MITEKQRKELVSRLDNAGFEFTIIEEDAWDQPFLKGIKDEKIQSLLRKYRSVIQEIKTAIRYDETLKLIEEEEEEPSYIKNSVAREINLQSHDGLSINGERVAFFTKKAI